MFRTYLTRVAFAVAFLALTLAGSRADASSICVSSDGASCTGLSSPIKSVTVGELFDLYLTIDAVTDLHGFTLDGEIQWNSSVITLQTIGLTPSVDEGTFLRDFGNCAGGPPCSTFLYSGGIATAGSLTFTQDTLADIDAGATGMGSLAILRFKAIGAGLATFTYAADPLFGDVFFMTDSQDNILDPTILETSVQVNGPANDAVPEPATMLLVGGGLVGVLRSRRHKRVKSVNRQDMRA